MLVHLWVVSSLLLWLLMNWLCIKIHQIKVTTKLILICTSVLHTVVVCPLFEVLCKLPIATKAANPYSICFLCQHAFAVFIINNIWTNRFSSHGYQFVSALTLLITYSMKSAWLSSFTVLFAGRNYSCKTGFAVNSLSFNAYFLY